MDPSVFIFKISSILIISIPIQGKLAIQDYYLHFTLINQPSRTSRLIRMFSKKITVQILGKNKFVIFTPATGHAIVDYCRGLTRFS